MGAAFPVGGAGERRDAGPAALVSVESRQSKYWSIRVDAEWSLLNARPAPAGQEGHFQYADLRTYGASLNGILRFPEDAITVYLLGGIGAYSLQAVDQRRSPYGMTGALQAGFGIEGNFWKRVNPFIEARALSHITDYGSDEYSSTTYWPATVGLRIRLRSARPH